MLNHWMFRCKDVSRKVSLSMDAPLPPGERLAVSFHLMMCRYCARFRRQLRQLRVLSCNIDAAPTDDGLSAAARERIKNILKELPECKGSHPAP